MASTTFAFSSSSSAFAKSKLAQKQNPLSLPLAKSNSSFLSPSLPLSSISLSTLSLSETPQRPTFTTQAKTRRARLTPEELTPEVTYKILEKISPDDLDDRVKRIQRRLNPPPEKKVDVQIMAVVMIGSRQYMVIPGRWIYTPRLKGANVNDKVVLNKVLLVKTKEGVYFGKPVVTNAAVHAVVEEQLLDDKVMVFKYKKKKNYRRKIGHRQPITRIRITGITGYEDYPSSASIFEALNLQSKLKQQPQLQPETVA